MPSSGAAGGIYLWTPQHLRSLRSHCRGPRTPRRLCRTLGHSGSSRRIQPVISRPDVTVLGLPGGDLRRRPGFSQPGAGRHFDGCSGPCDGTAVSCVRGAGRLSIGHDLTTLRRDTMLMRQADLARLSQPYPEDVDPPDSAAAAALGMELPNVTALGTDILADFTEQPPYGIGWWAPAPGTSRRILIADQPYCCVTSVAGNMTEAALHRIEYLDACDRDSGRFVDAVQMENGRPTMSAPRSRFPLDQLAPELIRIHYAGIIRALASALDCLAGAVIGVTA